MATPKLRKSLRIIFSTREVGCNIKENVSAVNINGKDKNKLFWILHIISVSKMKNDKTQ